MNYDAMLSYLGEFGPYQRRKVILASVACIPNAIHSYSVVFNLVNPTFRCAVPGLENDTYHIQDEAHQSMVDAFLPRDSDTDHYSQCSAYSSFWNGSDIRLTEVNQNKTVQCKRWVYDSGYASSSAITEWDLVCQNTSFRTHFNLMIMLGLLVGSLCGGTFADYFGRKKVVVGTTILEAILGIGIALVFSPFEYMVLRFILTAVGMAKFLAVFVFVAEIVGPKRRTLAEISTCYGFCVGLFVLILVCFLIQDWRIAQIVLSAPGLVFISYCWLLDESPRWLIVKGREKEARVIMENIAKTNKTKLPENLELKSSLESQEVEKMTEQKIWHICLNKILVMRIIILALGWCTSTMVYFGLTLNVNSLIKGNIYVTFTVQSTLETLGYALCMALLGRVGRKTLYCASLLISGCACLAMIGPVFAKSDIKWINILLFGMGKFGITSAFIMVYIVTTELLPTNVRNSGLGFCSFLGRIAGVISPYIASLGDVMSSDYGKTFPLVVFGVFAIAAALTSLMLPESKNKKLPETIEEAGNFGRNKKKRIYKSSQDSPTHETV